MFKAIINTIGVCAMGIAFSGCTTNPKTGAKTIDWPAVQSGIQTACAAKPTAQVALAAAATAVNLSVAATNDIGTTETLISIGCSLLPPATAPVSP